MKARNVIKRVVTSSFRGIGKSFYQHLRKQNNTNYGKESNRYERWQHDLEFLREMNLLPECWMGDVRWNNCYGVPNHQVKMRQIAKRHEVDD